MGYLQEREFSVLVLPLTLLMLLLATPHITFIQAELSKPRNMQQKFEQCQYQSYWKQLNEPKKLQCSRRELLATELNMDDEEDTKTNTSQTTAKGTNSVWIKASEDPNSDTIVKRMRDQIIMAEVYSKLEGSQKEPDLYNSLIRQSKACSEAIREADLDLELNQPRALRQAKKMDHILSIAETKLHDCAAISKISVIGRGVSNSSSMGLEPPRWFWALLLAGAVAAATLTNLPKPPQNPPKRGGEI